MRFFVVQQMDTTDKSGKSKLDAFLFDSRLQAFTKMQDLIAGVTKQIKDKYSDITEQISEGLTYWQFKDYDGRICRIKVTEKQVESYIPELAVSMEKSFAESESVFFNSIKPRKRTGSSKKMTSKDYVEKYEYVVRLLDKKYSLFKTASQCGLSVSTVSKIKRHLANYRKSSKTNETDKINKRASVSDIE